MRDGELDGVEVVVLALRAGGAFGRALRALEAHAAAIGARITRAVFE